MLSAVRARAVRRAGRGRGARDELPQADPGRRDRRERGVAGALTAANGRELAEDCELLHTGKIDVRKLDQEWAKYAPSFMDVARKLVRRRVTKRGEPHLPHAPVRVPRDEVGAHSRLEEPARAVAQRRRGTAVAAPTASDAARPRSTMAGAPRGPASSVDPAIVTPSSATRLAVRDVHVELAQAVRAIGVGGGGHGIRDQGHPGAAPRSAACGRPRGERARAVEDELEGTRRPPERPAPDRQPVADRGIALKRVGERVAPRAIASRVRRNRPRCGRSRRGCRGR